MPSPKEQWSIEPLTTRQQWLVKKYVNLVYHVVATKFNQYDQDKYHELVSIGNIALVRAAKGWIRGTISKLTGKTVAFNTYAYRTIYLELVRDYRKRQLDSNRMPVCSLEEVFKESGNSYDPSDEKYEVAKDQESLLENVANIPYEILNDRQRLVLFHFYGYPGYDQLSLEKIGKLLGVKKERVRQIRKAAECKLKGALCEKV